MKTKNRHLLTKKDFIKIEELINAYQYAHNREFGWYEYMDAEDFGFLMAEYLREKPEGRMKLLEEEQVKPSPKLPNPKAKS